MSTATSTPTAAAVHRDLLARAEDLVHEFADLPAGAVLRCFARAVAMSRRAGCEFARLPEHAEERARAHLARRARNEEERCSR